MKLLRFFGPFLTQMGPKVDFAPGAIRIFSDGHSLCHSGNGIHEWSGNPCVFVIPREFLFSFPFPQNSLGRRGGFITPVTIFPQKIQTNGTGLRLTQWLKLGVTVVRGERSGDLVHHYFFKKNSHFGETWTPKQIVIFWRKLLLRLASDSKKKLRVKVLSNSPFPFPFPQNSWKREWVIPRFTFPQDWREWPPLRILLCCYQRWGVWWRSQKVVQKSSEGLCSSTKIGWDVHRLISRVKLPMFRAWPIFENF